MKSLELIRNALNAECGIDTQSIDDQTNLLQDLEVDSLDLLNASFAIEKACGVVLPVREWLQREYGGEVAGGYFVVGKLCAYIEEHALSSTKSCMDGPPGAN